MTQPDHFDDLAKKLPHFWELSGSKIDLIDRNYDFGEGSPVFTKDGAYTTRGWTEWTEGFVYGSFILQFDATGEAGYLDRGKRCIVDRMAKHVSHIGVHDHGFNNVSTYGNLLRLLDEGRVPEEPWERHFYELALKCSGAVQAARWSDASDGDGFIYSFNGPHSLFADTIRSLRSLALAHQLGHMLLGENDRKISLLDRLLRHARTTARWIVYYGEGRDSYDIRGRVVHEAIFNMNDGRFRCPNTQQGYSPFSTWTRGLAWIITGFAEELEFLTDAIPGGGADRTGGSTPRAGGVPTTDDEEVYREFGGRQAVLDFMEKAAIATADFYLKYTPIDHIPYWDTGAPGLAMMGDYLSRPADPYNRFEPVDSSAAAIAAQGLIRLGTYLGRRSGSEADGADEGAGRNYLSAGFSILRTLLDEPYLSTAEDHQGLLLHSVYHRPGGWDAVPPGEAVPCGESSMWGDYHLREAALLAQRIMRNETYLTFFRKERDNR